MFGLYEKEVSFGVRYFCFLAVNQDLPTALLGSFKVLFFECVWCEYQSVN